MDEEKTQEAIARREQIKAFAEDQLKTRKVAIEFRATSGVERRWLEDEEAYNEGMESTSRPGVTEYATGTARRPSKQDESRSQVIGNIIRGRVETAVGRFLEVAFPTEGSGYRMAPTPVPEIAQALEDDTQAMQLGQPILDDQGQPQTMRDVAIDLKKRAADAMALMESTINDQLVEGKFNEESRKAAWQMVKSGVLIVKGPHVIKNIERSWKQTTIDSKPVYQIEVHEKNIPTSTNIDKWNFFPNPDCGEDVQKCSYIWERNGTMLRRDVRALIGLEGYDEEALLEVLDQEPKHVICVDTNQGYRAWSKEQDKHSPYESWEVTTDVEATDLEMLGCECEDKSRSYRASILFINDIPVKADLALVDTGDMPYDVVTWSPVEGSWAGIGIARMMIWWQRIIKGSLRAMMENSAESSRPHLVLSNEVQPVGGNWNGRYWQFIPNAKIDDVRKAFQQFQITNNQAQLQAVIDLALRFVDLETTVPAIFQAETAETPETLGVAKIMVNSSNISFRMRLKQWDDNLIRPHIRRYYDWNMQYNPDEKIKGDFNVVPIGASELYEQDEKSRELLGIWQLKGDPDVKKEVDWSKVIRQYFRMRKLDVMKAKEDISEEPEQPQMSPQAQVAQIRVQGSLEIAKIKNQSDMAELQFKAAEAEKDRQHQREMKQYELQELMLKLANEKNMSLESIKAMLAGKSMTLNTQVMLSDKGKPKQVADTDLEPVGHADDGQAFEE